MIAVVTAITDRYDHPRQDVFVDGVSYIFFSDEASADLAPGWEHVLLPYRDVHARIGAKPPKLNPHQFSILREFDYVILVDGGVQIRSEGFVDEILDSLGGGMVLSPHPRRTNILNEVEVSKEMVKYQEQPLDEQLRYYQNRGFLGGGLYECGVMARDMSHPVVPELGALWESQMINWSYQDQISLPYCLWRLDYQPAVLPKSFREYGWVRVRGHTRND